MLSCPGRQLLFREVPGHDRRSFGHVYFRSTPQAGRQVGSEMVKPPSTVPIWKPECGTTLGRRRISHDTSVYIWRIVHPWWKTNAGGRKRCPGIIDVQQVSVRSAEYTPERTSQPPLPILSPHRLWPSRTTQSLSTHSHTSRGWQKAGGSKKKKKKFVGRSPAHPKNRDLGQSSHP